MSAPLVSVLIPTYNGERFLEAALQSALGQTYRHIEVVVGDDASTDRTPEILAAAAATDPRVRVIRHATNVGAQGNPIRLLEQARGEYVKYLLHDDLLAPRCIELLLAGMQSADGISMAFSRRSVVDEHGRPVAGRQEDPLNWQPGVLDGRELGDLVLEHVHNAIGELSTVLFRRADVDPSTLWAIDGRSLAGNGDIALWLTLLARGDAFYSPETLSSFRSHGAQQTHDPRVMAGAHRDWPLLIDWGRRHGYLADPAQELRAHTRALVAAAGAHAALHADPLGSTALDAVFLATVRLLELRTGVSSDPQRPLPERAHGPVVGTLLQQDLDVWSPVRDVALASPAPDRAEVTATVAALREVQRFGAARQLVLAVHPELVDVVVPLVEDALATGPDIDVELVPSEDPARVLDGNWLAVVPRGASWPRERAGAVWSFDVPAEEHPPA